jgi:hypothetical protein
VLHELVERGIVGQASLAGAPLYFLKPPPSRTRKPRAKKVENETPAVAQAAPETWKPTVIRRKKADAEAAHADAPAPALSSSSEEATPST